MDRALLFTIGSFIRQESHPNHCLRFRTSTYILEFFLFRPPDFSIPIPCWALLLFLQVDRCQHLHYSLRSDIHLFRCKQIF